MSLIPEHEVDTPYSRGRRHRRTRQSEYGCLYLDAPSRDAWAQGWREEDAILRKGHSDCKCVWGPSHQAPCVKCGGAGLVKVEKRRPRLVLNRAYEAALICAGAVIGWSLSEIVRVWRH